MKTAIFGQFDNFQSEMAKRHIYGPRPFIWANNQVSMTFRSNVLACTKKSMTDRQTDGHPKPIGPQPFGLGPKNINDYVMQIKNIKLKKIANKIWQMSDELYLNTCEQKELWQILCISFDHWENV